VPESLDCLQALETGSSAALPDGLQAELEQLENNGGVRHLQELQKQVQVRSFCGWVDAGLFGQLLRGVCVWSGWRGGGGWSCSSSSRSR